MLVEFFGGVTAQIFAHGFDQAQGHDGIGGSVRRGFLDRHLSHADLAFAFADQFFDLGHLNAQTLTCLRFQPQAARSGVDHPLGDHGVKSDGSDVETCLLENDQVKFGIVSDFFNFRVNQDRQKRVLDRLQLKLYPFFVSDRDVIAPGRTSSQRDTHQIREHRIQSAGFGIKGDPFGIFQLIHTGFQSLSIVYDNSFE